MKWLLAFLGILALSMSEAYALRCGNKLVSVGDTKIELLQKCGEPIQVTHRKERYPIRIYDYHLDDYRLSYEIVYVEEWIYNFGPNRFMQSIIFRDGRISKIESLSYGY